MKILAVTNMYPTPERPVNGVFVHQQIEGLRSIGVDVQVLFVDRRREGAFSYYRMSGKVRGAVEEFGPDLVHVMYGGVMADQVTRMSGLPPVVVTFHGSDLLGENLSGVMRKWISRFGVHCSRAAAMRSCGVIIVAGHLVSALPQHMDREKLRVIPCGIDMERFKPMNRAECCARLGWTSDSFNVLFATSGNDPVKRPWLAHDAVKCLASRGAPAKLMVLSGVPNSEVPLWINASDALLLTSAHEGSPTIVKEALACGLPVVSVKVGDVEERIRDIHGCYMAGSVPTDLADKLDIVRRNGKRLDCRSRVQSLSLTAVAGELRAFYAEKLSQGRGANLKTPTKNKS